MQNCNSNIVKPFLRWAGGKNWLVKQIDNFLPTDFNNYHEPFLGGGSIFIHLKSNDKLQQKAYLSDINKELINAYQIVKTNPLGLIEELANHRNEEDYYYSIRKEEFTNNIERASRFIYLNRTSFNGIYRENQQGEYNVPFGFKDYKELFDVNNVLAVSKIMKNSFFSNGDFKKNAKRIKAKDLVFIDPPYTVAHGNNGFVKYNQKIFKWEDQIRLSKFLEYLKEIGAYYIMTNAHHSSIIELFNDHGDITTLSRASLIGGKGAKRSNYKEIILTNLN